MRQYELQVLLTKREPMGIAEWHESTTVDAPDMARARTMARQFAMLEASEQNAKIVDYYAIDDETGEQSQ